MKFVVVGHITRDVVPDGYTLGGTASYASIAAKRLGADVTVLTRADPDDSDHPALRDINVIVLPSEHTTTFENTYHNGVRQQQLRAVAAPILAKDVPADLYDADVMLLAPLVQEIDPDIALLAKGMVAATPQGWMREWDEQGLVHAVPWYSAGRILPNLDAIIFSTDDIAADADILPSIIETVPYVAYTQAAAGCHFYENGKLHNIPTRPATEVDPTGAGDTFAAAFLICLHECDDPAKAIRFANVAASFTVEGTGVSTIPSRAQVESYMEMHPLP